jgi:DNA repair protein RecO (recombination protein O)
MNAGRGLILNRLRYGDTSWLVTWISPQGRFKTMAKGALRPRSPFQNQIDLFYLCDLQYRRSSRGEIHALAEIKIVHPFLQLRRLWPTLLTAQYFGQLVENLTEPETAIGPYYELLLKALHYLEEKPATLAVLRRFELRLLEISGMGSAPGDSFETILRDHHLAVPSLRRQVLAELG